MGTEVLQPQGCLTEKFLVSPAGCNCRKIFPRNGNSIVSTWHVNNTGLRRIIRRSDHHKKKSNANHQLSKKSLSAEDLKSHENVIIISNNNTRKNPIKILRRGESFDSLTSQIQNKTTKHLDLAVYGTGRLGPDAQEMVAKQITVLPENGAGDIYAGSAFFMSPSPRALPLPSFFNINRTTENGRSNRFNDSATRDLRRLLRLE